MAKPDPLHSDAPVDLGLHRVLGLFSATCVVVGAIVGVGIFFSPSSVAKDAGGGGVALATWVVGGVLALLGGLTFAELGGMYGRTAGQFSVLKDAYGDRLAFCFVFCNATAIQAGALAIIGIICAENLAVVVGETTSGAQAQAVSVVLILMLAVANGRGVRSGSLVQNLTVVAKVGTLLLIIMIAFFCRPADVDPWAGRGWDSDGPTRLFRGLVSVLFAFGGWQQVLWIGGEVRNPRRNVPLATVLGVLVVIAIYLLVNWAYLQLLGFEGVASSRSLAAEAAQVAWPEGGGRILAAAVACSAFGVMNVQLLAGPRLVRGLATDLGFPRPLARVSERWGTPIPALLLIAGMGVLLTVVAGKDGVDRILTGVVLVDAVFFVLTAWALVRLRRLRPDADRPVRVPGYPWVPILFMVGEVAVIVGALSNVHQTAAIIGLSWPLVGLLIFVVGNSDRKCAGR